MKLKLMLDHQWRMPGNFDVFQLGFSYFGAKAWYWRWTAQLTVLGLVFIVGWETNPVDIA